MVGGVLDRTAHDEVGGVRGAGEDLARHDLHAVAVARASGHARYAEPVVIDRGDRARDVRAVSRIAVLLAVGQRLDPVPRNRSVGGEIPAVDVLIVVFFRGVRVGPHVGRQVGVGVFHPFVHDRHDDPAVASGEFPGVGRIDVGSGERGGGHRLVGVVDVVPLPEEVRVVEVRPDQTAGRAAGLLAERIGLAGRRPSGV